MQFDEQRVEEAAHGMLGGIVASRSGNAYLAAKAIDADEAAPGLFEVREGIIGAIDRPQIVEINFRTHRVEIRQIGEAPGIAQTCIVDEGIDPPIFSHGPLDQLLALRFIGQVGRNGDSLPPRSRQAAATASNVSAWRAASASRAPCAANW